MAIDSKQQFGQVVVGMETAQVNINIDARHDAVLAELPDGVVALPTDAGFSARITPDVEWIFVELRRQVLIVEIHGRVDHGLALEVVFEHASQQ